ncbi:hypothetical protein LSAT2_005284 [Lamellibrachia satsuma]|nr:hypothetical protein LSAT2_005284 [Lamellibrachia satsuma]
MENLEKLVLHDNELEAIPQDAFKGLNQLRYLDLNNNRLTSVCTYLVSHLTRLERLYFNNNQIETIPNDAFKRLNQSLKYLYVHNNRLSSVNPALFSHLPQLRELSLRGNHLVCDCRLAWLRKKRMIIQDHPLCFSPAPVNGIPVTSYNISKCYPLTVPDHWLMIGFATLSGAFAVALGASILALRKRMQRAMCRRAEAEVDPFTHNLPETRNTTLAAHETIAAPAPTYETAMGPLSTNPPEMDFETKNM